MKVRMDLFVYLITIARLGSISAAAEHLHVSQPTISQSLSTFEEQIGTKLFIRTKQGTTPTEIGQIVIEKARFIVQTFEEINELTRSPNKLIDNLTVATIPSLSSDLLPKVIAQFMKQYPLIRVKVIEGGTYEVVEMIKEGVADIGLVALTPNEHFDHLEELEFDKLTDGRLMVSVSEETELSKIDSIELAELINYPIAIYNKDYQLYHYILQILEEYGKPNILFESSNTNIVQSIILDGDAIGFCNNISIRKDPYFTTGQLVPVHIKGDQADFMFNLVQSRENRHTLFAKSFVQYLKDFARGDELQTN